MGLNQQSLLNVLKKSPYWRPVTKFKRRSLDQIIKLMTLSLKRLSKEHIIFT